MLRDQPMLRDGHAVDRLRLMLRLGRPLFEVDRPWEWRQQDELRECDVGLMSEGDRGVEGVLAVARQAEDERAEHVDAVMPKRTQPIDEGIAREVEPLVDFLQARFGY